MSPPRLATIWNTYGPYHIARVEALQRRFDDWQVVCLSHCLASKEYPFFTATPPEHRVIVARHEEDLSFFMSLGATIRLLRTIQPKLILTCGYERAETLGALIYAKLSRRTKVILMLDNQYADSRRNWLKEKIKTRYLTHFDAFLYGGDTHKDYLRMLHVPPSIERTGYNCVDNDRILAVADKARSLGNRPHPSAYFVCVARLIEKKNISTLLAAFAHYRQALGGERPWDLVIIGDGSLMAPLVAQARRLQIDEFVHFKGEVADIETISQYYAFAEFLILPSSHNEQWGLVVNEAMAARLPVLVSRACGCANSLVVDGKNGFVIDPTSPSQIGERLVWMQRHQHELARMGQASLEIVEQFSTDHFATNTYELYQENLERDQAQQRDSSARTRS